MPENLPYEICSSLAMVELYNTGDIGAEWPAWAGSGRNTRETQREEARNINSSEGRRRQE